MKFIFFLILTLQLIAIVQSQAAIGSGSGAAAEGAASGSDGSNGTGGSNGSGGGGNNTVQPATTPTSNPTTPANTGSPATQATPSNSPSSEPQTPTTQQASPSDQTTPSNTPDNTPSTGTTGNNNNTYSRNNSRTRSNNNSQTGNPTNSPSTGSGSSNNDNNSSNNNNNQGQGQQQDQGDQNSQGSGDNVGKIAGGVVGGVVALALVGGLLTWLNRRGGCTSRTKRRNHDTFDDFAMKDPESDKMGYNDTAMTSVSGGGNPASPFQRRMAPIGPQTTGYMNLGNEEFSETSTAVPLMNQDMSGYPHSGVMQPPPSDGYYGGYATPDYKTQLHQPADTWHQQDPSSAYYPPPVTSPGHDHQMKPDTVDHKPHEI